MIRGVTIKSLQTLLDDRGFFREIIREDNGFFSEGFGQLSHSFMYDGVIKAWHYHKIQVDWWYVVSGVLRVGLFDMREQSDTYQNTMDFLMGDLQESCVIKIPPGVAHGCKVVQGPVNLLYVTSEVYNPEDELRLPFNSDQIDFDWLEGPEIR